MTDNLCSGGQPMDDSEDLGYKNFMVCAESDRDDPTSVWYIGKEGKDVIDLSEIVQQLNDPTSIWYTPEEEKKRILKNLENTRSQLQVNAEGTTVLNHLAQSQSQSQDRDQKDFEEDKKYVIEAISELIDENPLMQLQGIQDFAHCLFEGFGSSTQYSGLHRSLQYRRLVWDWLLVQNIDQELHKLYPKLIGSGGYMGTKAHGYPHDGKILDEYPDSEARNIGVFTFTPVEW
jgi:hypothetical protein